VIALVRADNRLLHGQVLETWLPRLGVKEVVVADDEAASSALARAAMTLCVPPELPVRIAPIASLDWAALAAAPGPVLVLVRDVAQLAQAHAAGLTPALAPRLNIGNVHFGPGRRSVTPSVFLSEDELRTLRELASAGFDVELRAVPAEAPAGIDEIERRYAAAR
jgi:PTS system N-acetylgalactosamine-specific IIB component